MKPDPTTLVEVFKREEQCKVARPIFLQVESIYSRDHRTLRGYRAKWWARVTTSLLYVSAVSATEERAVELARAYLVKHLTPRFFDTTTGRWAPSAAP